MSLLGEADDIAASAWLMLAAGDNRQHGGNDGYDDKPAEHYSWDETVPNHAALARADRIALWDKDALIGVSVVDAIESGRATKLLRSCPRCGRAHMKARKTLSPRYKCFACGDTFDDPVERPREVQTYRSSHAAAWVALEGVLDGAELRALCLQPASQLSLRRLDWRRLEAELTTRGFTRELVTVEQRRAAIIGGHRLRTVRVRIGQPVFRRRLLSKFGSVCALSGPMPPEALEAAHLYSYAASGVHHPDGGLLLRRDLHALFDCGSIAVRATRRNGAELRTDLSDDLLAFPSYADLNDRPLSVDVTRSERQWLARHWEWHRG
jgi:ribosomal protein S27AE